VVDVPANHAVGTVAAGFAHQRVLELAYEIDGVLDAGLSGSVDFFVEITTARASSTDDTLPCRPKKFFASAPRFVPYPADDRARRG
jgi:hypothetical protein